MLNSLHIKNFRCFEDLTIPSLGRVNLIVGKNNSGKSTLLEAVSVFASKGRNLRDIMSARDELTLPSEDEEFLLFMKVIFHGRNTPEENQEIYIGSKDSAKFLTIKSTLLLEQFEEVKYAGGGTINRKTLIPFTDRNIIDDNNIKFGFSISDGNFSSLVDSLEYFRRSAPSWQRKDPAKLDTPVSQVPTNVKSSSEMATLWDDAVAKAYKKEIIKKLTIIDANIEDLDFININSRDRTAIATLENSKLPIPLKSMGEGISRLLQFFLHAHQAKNGYLLIDEFENGLHYSIQEEVWEKLFKIAKELDIQVFATTHSEDTVKAFCKISVADKEVNGKLISLGRSAAIADNGKILADVYDEETLKILIQSGMEVR